jgi:hypothetical protein
VEHYGAGEAYLPMLEALGRLCRGPGGKEVVALLGQQAPTWVCSKFRLCTESPVTFFTGLILRVCARF